jgi:hypothetical protein
MTTQITKNLYLVRDYGRSQPEEPDSKAPDENKTSKRRSIYKYDESVVASHAHE